MLRDSSKHENSWIGIRQQGFSCQQLKFARVDDEDAIQRIRDETGNTDLFISNWFSEVPDASALRNYTLCFRIVSPEIETVRVCALEVVYYATDHFSVPDECMEIIYNGGGQIRKDINSKNAADSTKNTNSVVDGANDQHNSASDQKDTENQLNCSKDSSEGSSAAEIVILIHPLVFAGLPTPLMPAINYYLARQMVKDGIKNIDIDVYQRDSSIPLPNSINNTTGRFIIPLTMKELLYLGRDRIVELSKQPRPDDSMTTPQEVPEAVEWFAEVHDDLVKKLLRQDDLQNLTLKNGWQIPSCIRRLTWADLDRNSTLEACRLISGMYSFLGSHEEEIRYHIMRLARRNSITGFKEYQKLNAIVTFGVENPMIAECRHPLLSRFCPAGGCFMKELIEEYEKPYLFEKITETIKEKDDGRNRYR